MAAEKIIVAGEGIVVHRFGIPGSRPKVYLQGALHADEVSATVALAELVGLLRVADAAGQVRGEIIVVPHCNPLGAKQFILGRHSGRFSLDGRNFNRAFPHVGERVVEHLKRLCPDQRAADDALRIGAGILDSLTRVGTPVERLQAALMGLAWGSDVIVDVHADMEATLHLYTSEKSWPVFQPLARRLDVPVVILADKSADSPFDEAQGDAWSMINAHLGESIDRPAFRPAACTLELRGLSDVTPELAASDGRALRDFLVQLGAVAGTGESAVGSAPLVTALDAVEVVKSTMTGVLIHLKPLGVKVTAGECVARLYDPFEPEAKASWQDVVAGTDGVIFARWHQRMIQAGMAVVKIAGSDGPLFDRPARLLD
ncbi:succinylglutamate desuccinylase/aspartoacylase family protein [Shinella sp. CPCC 101442]|uniref:succinylglutamate desuccinylase/aspartoacylase domain-containing protein n=1 Tax=Shinella sp. CPCC 101442 TaxID=2932265 RepID=UPI0021522936|nr:succinylglutamate desuccinylase/aspartoacylase family protein [Shinella sp. CPCC 101442]MCR6500424.1 succinylglutamate desuccinylase/aspartoacylase family protein [Shinella sp. CPCC 101442]